METMGSSDGMDVEHTGPERHGRSVSRALFPNQSARVSSAGRRHASAECLTPQSNTMSEWDLDIKGTLMVPALLAAC